MSLARNPVRHPANSRLLPLCLLLGALLLGACSVESTVLKPSGFAVGAPAPGTSFPNYVADAESRIYSALMQAQYGQETEPFGPGYPIEKVVAMRAPYELLPDQERCGDGERSGFLLIHGLTDSPYLLRSVAESLHERYPCALLRGLLLPGHGTVPGDTLKVGRDEWRAAVSYGVESVGAEVDAVYLVGFSLGTALALDYADGHRDDPRLRGLILLSPALVAGNPYAWLSPYVRWVRAWTGSSEEMDAARYRTLSLNAAAEFYLVTRPLTEPDFRALSIPVMMVATGDDTTVQSEPARQFFCDKTPEGQRHLLWYQSERSESVPSAMCPGIEAVEGGAPQTRVYSMSHVAIPVPPQDPHYGQEGAFSRCLRMEGEEARRCREDESNVVFGEINLGVDGVYNGGRVRRGTFNPHYAAMIDRIVCFIDGGCR